MDTLVRDPFRDALEAATGRTVAELFALRDPQVYPAFERGELDEAAYWAHYEPAGIAADPQEFHRVRRAGTRWIEGMAELADELGAAAVRRVAATNYPIWVEELTTGLLAGRIDHVVASCHVGVRKPEPAFYRRLLDDIELSPAEVAFIDDREVNVAAAGEAGLAAHRFTDAATARAWLVELGLPLRG